MSATEEESESVGAVKDGEPLAEELEDAASTERDTVAITDVVVATRSKTLPWTRPGAAVGREPEDVAKCGKGVAGQEESATDIESESVGAVKDGEEDAVQNLTATVIEQCSAAITNAGFVHLRDAGEKSPAKAITNTFVASLNMSVLAVPKSDLLSVWARWSRELVSMKILITVAMT